MIRTTFLAAALALLLGAGGPAAPEPTAPDADVDAVCGDCCPTYDPNVDCWAEGHWHYNHCKDACTGAFRP